jgi:hypothetical protein
VAKKPDLLQQRSQCVRPQEPSSTARPWRPRLTPVIPENTFAAAQRDRREASSPSPRSTPREVPASAPKLPIGMHILAGPAGRPRPTRRRSTSDRHKSDSCRSKPSGLTATQNRRRYAPGCSSVRPATWGRAHRPGGRAAHRGATPECGADYRACVSRARGGSWSVLARLHRRVPGAFAVAAHRH